MGRYVALALVSWPLSWAPEFQEPPTFRAEARLVVVQVTVRNAGGDEVPDLDKDAFTVYEDGKRQPLTVFLKDDAPVSVGMVIDNSGSMSSRRAGVEAAALAFARASNPLDEMFVVNFADRPRLDVPLTTDPRALEAGIARADAIGGTAMRDAVQMALAYLDVRGSHDRKALLLITDGNDNESTLSAEFVRREAQKRGVIIHAIALAQEDPAKARRARRELDSLTAETGGTAVYLSTDDEVGPGAERLARLIRRQYTLAYTPLNQTLDGSYRKIRVTVKSSAKLSAHTRAGYVAAIR
jgi:Ca-activated chloride channel family protein